MVANQTSRPEFILLDLSVVIDFQIPLFLLILLVYGATLAGNLLIIVLVAIDSHLQTPMYYFLGNLSVVDIGAPTMSASHLYFDIITGKRSIYYSTCMAQAFFFTVFTSTEFFLLAVMSYDRYVAICLPFHYTTMMSMSFFCELYQLVLVSCSDTSLNDLLISTFGVSSALIAFAVTFMSYVCILKAMLRIKIKGGRQKAFSTGSSHLTVVLMFYTTTFFNYIQPKAKNVLIGRIVSVVYAFFTPFLNPLIYSLRNCELRGAARRPLLRATKNMRPSTVTRN
ncbi:PREDICTED: olfactory receptor 5V1-like [Nanorana parkeri]|uniref:olfactory receptor 5V1-like n=1 Tax=Nanorana parkeri TaxID=125878 RepID=UPI0008547B57|nr:PREDICTED: olfactory receptor 5V1-like [Nanorana parkeri]